MTGLVRRSLAKTDAHLVSGGYQELRQDQSEFGWHDWVRYFHCTIVNQTTIEIEFS